MAEVQVIIRAIDKMTPTTTKVRTGLGGLVDGFKTAGIAMAGVLAAAYAVKKVFDATVGSVMNYNKSMLDSARAVGISTDQFSRIVQVADDFGISIESVKTALQLATKNGFAPSVESLAVLADKLNAMDSPTERAAAAAKIFGRNWAALDPLLQQGGQAIREASAAMKGGLVVTEAEAKKSEELRIQLDELNDSWTSLKNVIGNEAIPVVTSMTDFLNRIVSAAEDADGSILQFLVTMSRTAEARDLADSLKRIEGNSGRAASAVGGIAVAVEGLGEKTRPTMVAFQDMWGELVPPSAQELMSGFMDDLTLLMSPANAQAIADQGFLQRAVEGGMDPEQAKVLGTQIIAELAQGMVSEGEISKTDAVAWIQQSLGSTTTYAQALTAFNTNYAKPVQAWIALMTKPHEVPLELKTTLKDAIPSSWQLDLRPIDGKGFQHGGSFIVPGSGSGDRPYVVQLEPGERVDVTPRNQVKNFTFNTNVADGTDGSVLLSKLNEAARRA